MVKEGKRGDRVEDEKRGSELLTLVKYKDLVRSIREPVKEKDLRRKESMDGPSDRMERRVYSEIVTSEGTCETNFVVRN